MATTPLAVLDLVGHRTAQYAVDGALRGAEGGA
jgi:hypothetical protein